MAQKTKKPADHKPGKNDILTIETPQGVVKIKPFRMTFGMMRKNRDLGEMELTIKMIEDLADDEAMEIIDDLDASGEKSEFTDFIEEWQEASGVDLGESSASSE